MAPWCHVQKEPLRRPPPLLEIRTPTAIAIWGISSKNIQIYCKMAAFQKCVETPTQIQPLTSIIYASKTVCAVHCQRAGIGSSLLHIPHRVGLEAPSKGMGISFIYLLVSACVGYIYFHIFSIHLQTIFEGFFFNDHYSQPLLISQCRILSPRLTVS